MKPVRDVVAAIGRTPLIKLRAASEATGCTILGKAEFMNPGGSVKDRAALAIVNDAIAQGSLRPGGLIVEGTAGNTGIGLALVANALGYKTVIVIPDTQSQEKKNLLRLQGAELIEVPAVAYSDPNNYVKLSGRLASKLAKDHKAGAILGRTSSTIRPTVARISSATAEEIGTRWRRIHGFTCAAAGPAGRSPGSGWAEGRTRRVHRALPIPRRGAVQLLCAWRTEGGRLVGRRGDRAGADHRQSGGRADRYAVPDFG